MNITRLLNMILGYWGNLFKYIVTGNIMCKNQRLQEVEKLPSMWIPLILPYAMIVKNYCFMLQVSVLYAHTTPSLPARIAPPIAMPSPTAVKSVK